MTDQPKKEIKDFQDSPSFELFDELYQLGKKARFEYGEEEFSNFLITIAYQYRNKLFELETRKHRLMQAALLEEAKSRLNANTDEDITQEDMDSIDFDKLNTH